MTAKMILDAFSETLMQDERILSARERELLSNLLQNSKAVCGNRPEIQSAVTDAVARSVGETVAQRAFTVLGGSIVERILASSATRNQTEEGITSATVFGGPPTSVPQPPSGPQPAAVPQPPSGPSPMTVPQPPSSTPRPLTVPQPPSGPQGSRSATVPVQQDMKNAQRDSTAIGVGVLDAPANLRASCVVLDEFLAPQELNELFAYAIEHEAEFHNSEVISPSGEPGVLDCNHRRSRVLMDLGKHQNVILERIQGVLPRVLDQFGIEEFPVTRVEAQISASNDGDFFGAHSDNGQEQIASRRITFVYFFHREPRPFTGGELRLYDPRDGSAQHLSADRDGAYQTIVPQQNQIVFFPCSLMHEISPVQCSSQAFGDSRFTLNGWLHK